MTYISPIPSLSPVWPRDWDQEPKRIRLETSSKICSPEIILNDLTSIQGPLDIYFWYEGAQGGQHLPARGANFMKNAFLEPLYRLKKDAMLYLYSLKAWNFQKSITTMTSSTPIGEEINRISRINKAALECIYSSSFFEYCKSIRQENPLYTFISEELPKKNWLFNLSANQKKRNLTISELFNKQSSVFDCIQDLDVSKAYSPLQYIEGYYLIQESIKKGLLNERKTIQIAFVLPNDESKYYLDYPEDIEKMLQLDFGDALSDVKIAIYFHFFEYGDSLSARPYIDRQPKSAKITPKKIGSYFDYLVPTSFEKPRLPFQRTDIHKLNIDAFDLNANASEEGY